MLLLWLRLERTVRLPRYARHPRVGARTPSARLEARLILLECFAFFYATARRGPVVLSSKCAILKDEPKQKNPPSGHNDQESSRPSAAHNSVWSPSGNGEFRRPGIIIPHASAINLSHGMSDYRSRLSASFATWRGSAADTLCRLVRRHHKGTKLI